MATRLDQRPANRFWIDLKAIASQASKSALPDMLDEHFWFRLGQRHLSPGGRFVTTSRSLITGNGLGQRGRSRSF